MSQSLSGAGRRALVGVLSMIALGASIAADGARPGAGIYLVKQTNAGAEEMVRIRGARPRQVQTHGMAKTMLSQGILKPTMSMELAGTTADVHTASSPVFQFYFDVSGQASLDASNAMAQMMGGDAFPPGAKTAADFVLVQLTPTKDTRHIDMGKMTDGKPKNIVETAIDRIDQGAYRVAPKSALKSGEYAFVFYNSQPGSGMSAVWDFSVDASK